MTTPICASESDCQFERVELIARLVITLAVLDSTQWSVIPDRRVKGGFRRECPVCRHSYPDHSNSCDVVMASRLANQMLPDGLYEKVETYLHNRILADDNISLITITDMVTGALAEQTGAVAVTGVL